MRFRFSVHYYMGHRLRLVDLESRPVTQNGRRVGTFVRRYWKVDAWLNGGWQTVDTALTLANAKRRVRTRAARLEGAPA